MFFAFYATNIAMCRSFFAFGKKNIAKRNCPFAKTEKNKKSVIVDAFS